MLFLPGCGRCNCCTKQSCNLWVLLVFALSCLAITTVNFGAYGISASITQKRGQIRHLWLVGNEIGLLVQYDPIWIQDCYYTGLSWFRISALLQHK